MLVITSTARPIAVTKSSKPKAAIPYCNYRIVDSCLMFTSLRSLKKDHVQNATNSK